MDYFIRDHKLGLLGFIDDYLKISRNNNSKGINAKTKLQYKLLLH